MWYFSWILGVGLACFFGILNALWYELHITDKHAIWPADMKAVDE